MDAQISLGQADSMSGALQNQFLEMPFSFFERNTLMRFRHIRTIVFASGIFFISAYAQATTPADSAAPRKHFGGGMLFQAGAIIGEFSDVPPVGIATGLGGRLYLPMGRFLAVGGGGAVVTMTYPTTAAKTNYLSAGYGGLTIEARTPPIQKCIAAAGILAGGGRLTRLHIYESSGTDTIAALFTNQSMAVFSPYLSVEYPLTNAINFAIMFNYCVGIPSHDSALFRYAQMQIGILFSR